ncbi:hypothetical protein PPO43_01250 [Saprospira sp. CCB-QB6]|uniref:hypothetical protein n=1 Tax=Saprospira sp. CCB-QB6 TaxID=3023936 RepID=UPI00234BF3A8|nr:hypothetical protein [Saprospira sp. CCB-QB6]WCL81721.1 hypothetical protein PPO43_01250 [Saprospira sp. CCB-QB6]
MQTIRLFMSVLALLLLGQTAVQAQIVEGTYKLRIAAMSQAIDSSIFAPLAQYGVLSYEPTDKGLTRIYLGKYFGKATAQRILAEVKKKGFNAAYIVQEDVLFESVDGDALTHSLQFSADRLLDVSKLQAKAAWNEDLAKQLHISYANGYYRVSFGLLNPSFQAVEVEKFRNALLSLGYKESFLRRFSNKKTANK